MHILFWLSACKPATAPAAPPPAQPAPEPAPPAPEPAPEPAVPAPAEPAVGAQGEPCADGGGCAAEPAGLLCVEYYGIAGPRGPKFTSCEIPCAQKGATCPEGQSCVTIADGPGQVCR